MARRQKFCGTFTYRFGILLIAPLTLLISAFGLFVTMLRRDWFSPFLPGYIIGMTGISYGLWAILAGVGLGIVAAGNRKVAKNITFLVVCMCGFSLVATGLHIIMLAPHHPDLQDACIQNYAHAVGNGTADSFHGWNGNYIKRRGVTIAPPAKRSIIIRAAAAPPAAAGGGSAAAGAGAGGGGGGGGNGGGGANTPPKAATTAASPRTTTAVNRDDTETSTASAASARATSAASIAATSAASAQSTTAIPTATAAAAATATSVRSAAASANSVVVPADIVAKATPICSKNVLEYYGIQIAISLATVFIVFSFSATFARYVNELDEEHRDSRQKLFGKEGRTSLASVDSLEFEHGV